MPRNAEAERGTNGANGSHGPSGGSGVQRRNTPRNPTTVHRRAGTPPDGRRQQQPPGYWYPAARADAAAALARAAAPAHGSALPAVSAVSAARCTRTGDRPGRRPARRRPEPVQPVGARLNERRSAMVRPNSQTATLNKPVFDQARAEAAVRELLLCDRRGPGSARPGGHPGPRRPELSGDVRRSLHRSRMRCWTPPSTSSMTNWCWSKRSRCIRPANTTWWRFTVSRTSDTFPVTTAG